MVMTGGWFIIVLTTLYPICIALPLPASPGEIHLDPGSAPLLPAGPVGVDPVATAELPSAVRLAKQALPPGADGGCCGFYLGNLGKVWEKVNISFIQNNYMGVLVIVIKL